MHTQQHTRGQTLAPIHTLRAEYYSSVVRLAELSFQHGISPQVIAHHDGKTVFKAPPRRTFADMKAQLRDDLPKHRARLERRLEQYNPIPYRRENYRLISTIMP